MQTGRKIPLISKTRRVKKRLFRDPVNSDTMHEEGRARRVLQQYYNDSYRRFMRRGAKPEELRREIEKYL